LKFFKNLHYYEKQDLQIQKKYLVYGGSINRIQSDVEVVSWEKAGNVGLY